MHRRGGENFDFALAVFTRICVKLFNVLGTLVLGEYAVPSSYFSRVKGFTSTAKSPLPVASHVPVTVQFSANKKLPSAINKSLPGAVGRLLTGNIQCSKGHHHNPCIQKQHLHCKLRTRERNFHSPHHQTH